ncbi:GCR1-dependent translation factor 1 [Golovinomyces cichoracearum]|uniref:GCR1-dependent translation factor 1 n=1 Tax=Golovinomyces cichoracearum TaxID=62708 RepID=A0A420ILB9_9PEZI|nr:GCR1-dependent translation factor 1 [Golovinomyces cichoracearum]
MNCVRCSTSALILFLLVIVNSTNVPSHENSQIALSSQLKPGGSKSGGLTTAPIDLNKKPKYEIGTKDAPVDGNDGKPHAGPWVGTEKNLNKEKPTLEPQAGDSVVPESKHNGQWRGSQENNIPAVNDGVMDDPTREPPKHGTTGTEGGVSQKDKARKAHEGQTGERLENTPASPKEASPQPLNEIVDDKNEKPKAKDAEDIEKESKDGLAGLEKPDNLPDRLNNLPHPIPGSAKKNHLDIPKGDKKKSAKYDLLWDESDERFIQPLHSYFLSLTMILFSEIGDKTFLVAVLMAMKHDRFLVFSSAFTALFVMTVLSATFGHIVPTLIPKRYTNFLAAVLFLVFGGRMLKEGLEISPGEGVGAEMKEVEMELERKDHIAYHQKKKMSSFSPYALEMGLGRPRTRRSRSRSRLPSPPRSPMSSPDRSPSPQRSLFKTTAEGLNNLLSFVISPAWVQTFVMTFLGEWGDRSQIATIAMAAGQDYLLVTAGAVCGHAICTAIAVIGGRAIAGKVSLRVVTLGGSISFLIFGVIYMVEAYYS